MNVAKLINDLRHQGVILFAQASRLHAHDAEDAYTPAMQQVVEEYHEEVLFLSVGCGKRRRRNEPEP